LDGAGDKKEGLSKPDESSEALKAEADALNQEKVKLDEDAAEIKKQRLGLIDLSKDLKGRKNIMEYNIKVEALNEKIRAFQLRQEAYIEKAEAYNKEINTPKTDQ